MSTYQTMRTKRRRAAAATLIVTTLCACPKNHEPSAQPSSRDAPREPTSGTTSLQNQAGTYDPLVDRAPATGPGAPGAGDVPGMGMSPIDHPVRNAEPAPVAPAPAEPPRH